jgi:hypothetical protein
MVAGLAMGGVMGAGGKGANAKPPSPDGEGGDDDES